jgi:hypothetical protein
VEALASTRPIGERLAALHALAAATRERLVFDMTNAGAPAVTTVASLQTARLAVVQP